MLKMEHLAKIMTCIEGTIPLSDRAGSIKRDKANDVCMVLLEFLFLSCRSYGFCPGDYPFKGCFLYN